MVHLKTEWVETQLKHTRVEYLNDGALLVLYLSRPKKRNAWTEFMRNEICYTLDMASKDPKVRAIVITGDPAGNAFCAGMDLDASPEESPGILPGDVPEGRPVNNSYWRDGGGTAGLAIMRCAKPVLAALNGSAVGVGMTLPLCCDMSVAAEDAKYGVVFGARGLTMECLSSKFLARCVGYKKAMELVLTARVFPGREAPQGLFNYIVPSVQVLPKALELAREVVKAAPVSAAMNRALIIRNMDLSPEEAHLVESRCFHYVSSSADAREGVQSFLEKRAPKWGMDPFKDVPPFFPWWKEVVTRSKL